MATTLQLQICSIEEQEPNPCFLQNQPSFSAVPDCDCFNIKFQYFSSHTVHPSNPAMPLTVFKEDQFSFPCDLFCEFGDHLIQDAFSSMDIPSQLSDLVSSRVVSFARNMVADNCKGCPVLNMAVRIHVTNYTPGAPNDVDDSCRQVLRENFVSSLGKVRVDDDGSRCSICLDKFCDRSEVVGTPCSHVFHRDCILRWFKDQSSCPLCRYHVPC